MSRKFLLTNRLEPACCMASPETMHVRLCDGCIDMLEEYNPYVVPIIIEKVSLEECDNYTDSNGHFVNLEKGGN